VWDTRTGVCKMTYELPNPVRTCGFSYSGNLVLYSTDKAIRNECFLYVRDIREPVSSKSVLEIPITSRNDFTKITSAIWSNLDDNIVTGHDNGDLMLWDVRVGKLLQQTKPHNKTITDLQTDREIIYGISASKDNCAKLFDLKNLKELKCYKTEKPVNSAAIAPLKDHV
jgi:translation initiation factor 3 subunit I